MPYGYPEPYGNSFAQMGQSIGLMRQSQMQGRIMQQRLAFQQEQARQLGELRRAQADHAQAQAGYETTRTEHQSAVDTTAQNLGQAVFARDGNSLYGTPGGITGPPQDPTLLNADVNRQMAISGALAGNPQRGFPTADVSPGHQRINPATGQVLGYVQPNPIVQSIPAGGTPFVLQGDGSSQVGDQTAFRPPTVRPYFQPAGSIPVDANGKVIGTQAPFRPGAGAGGSLNRFSPVAAKNAALADLSMLQNARFQDPTNAAFGRFSSATNQLRMANDAIQQALSGASLGQTNAGPMMPMQGQPDASVMGGNVPQTMPGRTITNSLPGARRYRYNPETGALDIVQ